MTEQHTQQWAREVEAQRERKDEYFGEDQRSPLPPDVRAEFDGLDYYEVDPDYRFVVELEAYDEPEPVVVGTSTDGEQEYLAWGEFTVEIAGEAVSVTAYKGDSEEDRLWVPFRDETSGEETYGAGRYLDLEPEHHRTEDGRWILDFNEAYNPTCAYSDRYECPLPPTENWLDVPIEAGERAFEK
ncbi:DUF1684 domain-containing protein [Haloarchaeobius iranensis]|uniref:DUF1684 domain-containing protein n=1 Tax=Haloarchaeobius iranensis TaxID=996166 RepID=A0A1G9YMV0_9EURY|nr:DUF1684 domain-containing protein [Haloarchaeobius iranensis]SDN09783.1 hypothetical protein SAMN05192554_11520 [Haloarchaeobius iranensis]